MIRRFATPLAVLVALAACEGDTRTADANAPARVAVGAPAPGYSAVTLAGDSVALAGQRGKVVLLNVWATWCTPCRDEIPELQQLHVRYQRDGLEVIGVSVDADGTDDSVREFLQEFGATYAVWRDPGERVNARFLVVGVPTTFLIDRDGVLRWRKTGPIASGDTVLLSSIERALGGPTP